MPVVLGVIFVSLVYAVILLPVHRLLSDARRSSRYRRGHPARRSHP